MRWGGAKVFVFNFDFINNIKSFKIKPGKPRSYKDAVAVSGGVLTDEIKLLENTLYPILLFE